MACSCNLGKVEHHAVLFWGRVRLRYSSDVTGSGRVDVLGVQHGQAAVVRLVGWTLNSDFAELLPEGSPSLFLEALQHMLFDTHGLPS
jgi:hypothetical protein